MSGFLSYQAEYAELRFTDTLMPDLETAEIETLLASYQGRRYSQ
jgi:undecaprenyl diphosphate synthase